MSTPSVFDILGDRQLFAVAVALLSEYSDRGARVWSSWGMPYQLAVDILTGSGLSDYEARDKVEEWIDASFFVVIEVQIEFVFPELGRQLDQAINASEDYTLAKVLSLTLRGVRGRSMGVSNEWLICKYLCAYLDPPATGYTTENLVFNADHSVAWRNPNRGPIKSADELDSLLCKWQGEIGIDRIWLKKLEAFVFEVYAMQLKTGDTCAKITPGVLASQRNKPHARFMDDTCIAGLLVKAERGFSHLMPKLRNSFPEVTFTVGTLTIYATKASASDAASQFETTYPSDAGAFKVDDSLRPNIFGRQRGNPSIPWKVVAGTEWLRDVLPSRVMQVL